MNKVDSSSLASFTSPLYRLTTPAAREEQGTSLYLRYNIPPHGHAPRVGSAKEATSGVFAGPAWPDFASPAVASLGAIPPRPPVAARTAGEAAGLDESENSIGFKPSRAGLGCNKPTFAPRVVTRVRGLQGPRCRGRMPALMGLPFGVGPSGVVLSKHVPVTSPDVSGSNGGVAGRASR